MAQLGNVSVNIEASDRYLPLKALAAYSGLSVRTLRARLVNRTYPLPHFRIGGKIVVRQRDYDDWASRFRVQQVESEIDALVDEVMKDLG
jgi:predicted DNA-binding transcriptional regulator AlpA